jgi:hypothetical protein
MNQRQEVIAQFQTPITDKNRSKNPVVMLISLKSGAVGLNLTAASNVFLVSSPPFYSKRANGSVIRGGNLPLKLRLLIVFIEYVYLFGKKGS